MPPRVCQKSLKIPSRNIRRMHYLKPIQGTNRRSCRKPRRRNRMTRLRRIGNLLCQPNQTRRRLSPEATYLWDILRKRYLPSPHSPLDQPNQLNLWCRLSQQNLRKQPSQQKQQNREVPQLQRRQENPSPMQVKHRKKTLLLNPRSRLQRTHRSTTAFCPRFQTRMSGMSLKIREAKKTNRNNQMVLKSRPAISKSLWMT